MTNINTTNTFTTNTTDNSNVNKLDQLMEYIDLDSINTDDELSENAGLLEAAVNTNDKRLLKTTIKSDDIAIRIPMEILAENEEAVKSVILKSSKSIASVVSHVSDEQSYDEVLEAIESSMCKSSAYGLKDLNTPISKVDIADGEAVTIYIDSSVSRMLNNVLKHPKTCEVINRICKLVESFYDLVKVFKIEEAKWLKSILSRFHKTAEPKKR